MHRKAQSSSPSAVQAASSIAVCPSRVFSRARCAASARIISRAQLGSLRTHARIRRELPLTLAGCQPLRRRTRRGRTCPGEKQHRVPWPCGREPTRRTTKRRPVSSSREASYSPAWGRRCARFARPQPSYILRIAHGASEERVKNDVTGQFTVARNHRSCDRVVRHFKPSGRETEPSAEKSSDVGP